ncbi:MAG: KH domain-containing protein [Anaerolineae bacterium]|nr:KH domain-containing protein [Anaerolineae bacterium]
MEELIGYIARSLVDDPTQVKVSQRVSSGTVIVELRVAQEDTGRVIGKGGQVANAMRSLLRASGDSKANRVVLKIL